MSDSSEATAGAARPGSPTGQRLFAVMASIFQVMVMLLTFFMGLGWGGPTYSAALLQTVLAFVVIVGLARYARHASLSLLVPLLSGALTFALVMLGEQLGHTGA